MSVRVIHDTGGLFSSGDVTNRPCVTVLSSPRDANHYKIVIDDLPEPSLPQHPDKPPYRVPPMEEIRSIPWNGFKVASTFSGCGGSCLGYRMAGYRVVWANEFVPVAQESYRANMSADSILDGRDIRQVQPEEILEVAGLDQGELDLFDGSPPCQAFSTAGKREKGWGTKKKYEHGAEQCNETLFSEYIRLLRGLMPKTFIAENVSGLVKGTAKGWFIEVLAALKASGYRVKAKLLDAQWLGVPQARQRIIFAGVRDDLKLDPVYPKPLPYRYSVRDALPWIGTMRIHGEQWASPNRPRPTIGASDGITSPTAQFSAGGWVQSETDISRFAIGAEWDRLNPGEKSDKYLNLIRPSADRPCPTITALGGDASRASVTHPTEKRKFTIDELKAICGFPPDFILCGSYAQQWERLGNSVPPLMMKAIASEIRDRILS